MITKVRMFGGFRKYLGAETYVQFEQAGDLTVGQIKELIAAELKKKNAQFNDLELLQDSALANEETVFASGDLIPAGRELAILPPVCGG